MPLSRLYSGVIALVIEKWEDQTFVMFVKRFSSFIQTNWVHKLKHQPILFMTLGV